MSGGVDRAKLKALLNEASRSARDVSLKAKQGETAVKDILSGKSKRPEFATLQAIAKELGVGIDAFVTEGEEAPPPSAPRPKARAAQPRFLFIEATVQAGAWLQVNALDQRQPEEYPVTPDPRYPRAKQWLSRVQGDSMNDLTRDGRPAGIYDGDLVHCVSMMDIDRRPQTGDIVEVERIRFDGAERELTIKEVEVLSKRRMLLWPRSTNPVWRDPVRPDVDAEGEKIEVRIRGLVLRSIRQF